MARDASSETHRRITTEGLLSEAQTKVYDALFHHGPCTAAELAQRGKIDGGWKRLSELKRRGCAAEVGFKTCCVTGSHALVWDVTSKMPEPIPAIETTKDRIRHLERTVRRQERKLEVYRELIRKLHTAAASKEASQLVLSARLLLESEGLGE